MEITITLIIIVIIICAFIVAYKIFNHKEMKAIIALEEEEDSNNTKIGNLEAKFGKIPLGLSLEKTISLLIEHKILPEKYNYSSSNYRTTDNHEISLECFNDLVYKIIFKYHGYLNYKDIKNALNLKYGEGIYKSNSLDQTTIWENDVVKIILDSFPGLGIRAHYLDKRLQLLKVQADKDMQETDLKNLTNIL